MNVTYTGKQGDLPLDQQKKLAVKFARLAKLVEVRGANKAAHVAVTTERHLTKAEISMNYYDHALACVGAGPDFFTAMTEAVDRLEKQALKVREKWRDNKRSPKDKSGESQEPGDEVQAADSGPRIYRVNHRAGRKPMTLEEAMLAIDGKNYMVYRDTDRDCVSVLIRRADGNFDLVES